MYYESYLEIDLGGHPARPRPARQLLRNLYLLHQRIYAAFDQQPRAEKGGRLVRSANDNWVLFRVMAPTRSVLVRSRLRPDWEKAFRKHSLKDAWVHLAEPPVVERKTPDHSDGRELRFSLRANPTIKKRRGKPDRKEDNGYRVSLCYPKYALAFLDRHRIAVSDEEKRAVEDENGGGRELRRDVVERALIHWLERKGEAAGFDVERAIPVQEGFRHLWRPAAPTRNGRLTDMSLRSVIR